MKKSEIAFASTAVSLAVSGYLVLLCMKDGASFVEAVGITTLIALLLAAVAGIICLCYWKARSPASVRREPTRLGH